MPTFDATGYPGAERPVSLERRPQKVPPPAVPATAGGHRPLLIWLLVAAAAAVIAALAWPLFATDGAASTMIAAVRQTLLSGIMSWRPMVMALAFTTLPAYPIVHYLHFSWSRKRDEILNSLAGNANINYLAVYASEAVQEDVDQRFAAIYDRWYARSRYTFPAIALLAAVLANMVVSADALLKIMSGDASVPVAAAAAFGAYTYVTSDLIDRQQRRDLSTSDVTRGAVRMAIAIPLGTAFASLVTSHAAFLAFAIGVFPLDTIATILRRLVNKQLKLELGADTGEDQVAKLSGVDASTADRIHQADITTISQLAWCDPVQLSMRSNLSFSFVADVVSQALAWVYLGSRLAAIAPMGLRGAVEIRSLWQDYTRGSSQKKAAAVAVIEQVTSVTTIEQPGLLNAFEQIAEDPATAFLFECLFGNAAASRDRQSPPARPNGRPA